jgi:hypothetical protein
MDRLVEASADAARGPAARASLARLCDAKIPGGPFGWLDWWERNRKLVRLDPDTGKFLARGAPGAP